ncbi:MAG: hypothetical protein HY920_04205 [Elusimicrobia bacterium]|nr:hypothetical protein [Elusimicrobiota bacterium]
MEHKVVAHFLTKEIKKGTAYDFTSDAPMMHLLLLADAGKRQVDRISLDLIKEKLFSLYEVMKEMTFIRKRMDSKPAKLFPGKNCL